jgi:hypothetical protein
VSTDQRTHQIDRVLNAISPALSAEIDHMIDEKCAELEMQQHARLQHAIRETEETIRKQAEVERRNAVERVAEETRDIVRRQVSDELQAQFAQRLDETTRTLTSTHEAELQQARAEWAAERDRIQQQLEKWRSFAEAQKQLFDANSQGEILMRWLKLAEPFGSSIAVYTAKPDGLGLWKSRGQAVFPEVISQQTTDPDSFFMPIVVRGKAVAAVSALAPYHADALDFLVNTMERALETFGLKLRSTIQKAPAPAPAPEAARIR